MIRLFVPAAVAVVLILSLTYVEAVFQDRFSSSSMDAAEFGKRFAAVPMKVGDWVGRDTEVANDTLETAGAVNHVSRTYVNEQTRQTVDLWLIVGHARDIVRHTPDICYPSQGFSQQGEVNTSAIEPEGERPARFYTAKFRSESGFQSPWQRVFWAWNGNNEEQLDWEAPAKPRIHFGNNSALYKLYFTASMSERDEVIEDNVAVDFANEMLPVINRALFPDRYPDQPDDVAAAAGTTPSAGETTAGETTSDKAAAGEAASDLPPAEETP